MRVLSTSGIAAEIKSVQILFLRIESRFQNFVNIYSMIFVFAPSANSREASGQMFI